ncbi:ABC transporter ATP-binding protein [Ramlibacter sp. AW1]|uniref:ABC transporter ATP-binding protein n=1 Tax=Ramlibacter aurantiacus TaxID=2801330 RepID=A0A936ZNM5_9BURK|nr:ABC transporter ATP-binding protein [Ramlibacter aurantiacus]MBL0423077.1 ABC transporter ATP-binding protein [Ramlibacter aurantiacus]
MQSTSPAAAEPGPDWRNALQNRLDHDENVLATLEVDIGPAMQFATGALALTDRRLLGWQGGHWSDWRLCEGMVLRHADHAGIGTLELCDHQRRLALWRFTLAQQGAVLAFIARFERLQAGAPEPVEAANDDAEPDEDDDDSRPTSTWILLRLGRFARPYRKQLAVGFVLTLASTAATLVPPYLTIPLMDEVLIPFQNGQRIDPGFVGLLLAGLLGSALLAWGLGWARTWLLALVSERIAADLRTAAFEHLLQLSLDYFGSKRTGDLVARIGSETDRISVFLSLHALDFATDVLMFAMTAAILFSIDPSLALATLLPLPFIAWMIHAVRDRLRTGFEKIDRVWGDVTSVLADTIPGIRVVKAFAQERREAQRFREANQTNLAVNDRLNKTWSVFSPTVSLLTDIGLLVVWAFGIWLVSRGQITVGVLTAFIAYIGRFYTRLDSMSRIVSVTQKAAAGAKRIFDILDHVSNVPEPAQPVKITALQGAIEMQGLGFRYGNRSVIRDLNLSIRPGEMIGLVGHSGSGKSTLVNLICRFYDVSEGSIRVDGTDIRRFAVADYRRHIGLVLQEPFLFFGTIAENIAYGRPDASRAEIVAAARAAHAHEFILRLPLGYDSMVGERGQGLSGGERQRISIARALLIDPRILILDEATSSVDTETEKEIQKALDNLVQGRTTIAIAHRLSTLRRADRLVVMDRGRVVEVGPHDELMARQGSYWRLYEAQARRVEDDGSGGDDVQLPGPAHAAHPAGQ